jgi:1-acyl-sn-glycerol-3-phosphate acyltransferase
MYIYNPFNPNPTNLVTPEQMASPYTLFWNRLSILINAFRVRILHKTQIHFRTPWKDFAFSPRTLVVSNHSHSFDIPIVVGIFPIGTYFSFLAKKELYENPFGRFYFTSTAVVSVDRQKGLEKNTLKSIKNIMNAPDWVFCMFPEGTRGNGETLLPMKEGAAQLGQKNQADLLPMGIYIKDKKASVVVGKLIPFDSGRSVEATHALIEAGIASCFSEAKERYSIV